MPDHFVNFLSTLGLFADLPENQLHNAAACAGRQDFAGGEALYTEHRPLVDGIYILEHGEVEILSAGKDQIPRLDRLRQGGILGGEELLTSLGLRVMNARATTDTRCYTLSLEVLEDLCRQYPLFNRRLAEIFQPPMPATATTASFLASRAIHFLSTIAPFSFLSEGEIEQAAGEMLPVFHPRNTTLFSTGLSKIDSLHIIHRGAAERFFEDSHHKIDGALMGEGDIFGGISILLNNAVAIRSLRTTEDTHFYLWPKRCFLDTCDKNAQFLEYFTDTFGKRMLDRSYAAIVATTMQPGEEAHQFLDRPISTIPGKALLSCPTTTTIQAAAQLMSSHNCGSILIASVDKRYIGIVTDGDLRQKVVAADQDIQAAVERIMSVPLRTISGEAQVFEALITMMQANIQFLGITDAEGEVVGILSSQDILAAQGRSPLLLIGEIAAAGNIETLKQQYRLLPGIIQMLIASGAKATSISRLITTVSDAILQKIITLAIVEHGPPPCAFAFMVMGSEGRKEQTLSTDQDNAIIFEDVEPALQGTTQAYFLALGSTICRALDDVGYRYCKGDIMAQNPQWCQPLAVWKDYFRSWIRFASAEDLLNSTIFFDLRCAHGHAPLVTELRIYLMERLVEWPLFLGYLAMNAQHFKPPLGFFRNFLVESKGEHRDTFDIKKVLVPIVDFARIFALKHGFAETNTQERLHRLFVRKFISEETYYEMEQAYTFLMQLRFARQINVLMEGKNPPDNHINPKKLTRIEQTTLKEIFSRIDNMQKEIVIRVGEQLDFG